jgi:SAM-dependent methyltransferase
VGYWSFWAGRHHRVHGVDRSKSAIALAEARVGEFSRQTTFSSQEFAEDVADGEFDCVVSLQGLQHELVTGNFAALDDAARHLRKGGHLILVEGGLPGVEAAPTFDAALHGAGLSPLWITDCGGLGFASEPFRYLGLIATKDGNGSGSVERFFDMTWWQGLAEWTEEDPSLPWERANSAYYWASGAPVLRAAD